VYQYASLECGVWVGHVVWQINSCKVDRWWLTCLLFSHKITERLNKSCSLYPSFTVTLHIKFVMTLCTCYLVISFFIIGFLRHLLGITKLDKEKNQCIREKTEAQDTVKEIKRYREKWLQHVQRIDTNRITKQALQYKPKGRRNIGRPRKRWRDQLHLDD